MKKRVFAVPERHTRITNYFQGAIIHNMVINGNMYRNGTETYYSGGADADAQSGETEGEGQEGDETVPLEEEPKTSSKAETKKRSRRKKVFREFIKDAKRTEEIVAKLHELIGNKSDTAALKVIREAIWIDLIDRPTAPSIKAEFPNITCRESLFSTCFNEAKPTQKSMLEAIREKFGLDKK